MRFFRRRKFEPGELARFILITLLIGLPLALAALEALASIGIEDRGNLARHARTAVFLLASFGPAEADYAYRHRRRRYSAPGVPGTTGRSGSSTWNDAPSPGDDST